MRQRLEARLALEPEMARLAATRCTDADLELMRESISAESSATTSDEVHDSSRAFHFAVAGATQNNAFTKLLEGLWIADVGRLLLAQRRRSAQWQGGRPHARARRERLPALVAAPGRVRPEIRFRRGLA